MVLFYLILNFKKIKIKGDLEIIGYNLLPVDKLDKIFKPENIVLQCDKRFEFPISNIRLFYDEVRFVLKIVEVFK